MIQRGFAPGLRSADASHRRVGGKLSTTLVLLSAYVHGLRHTYVDCGVDHTRPAILSGGGGGRVCMPAPLNIGSCTIRHGRACGCRRG